MADAREELALGAARLLGRFLGPAHRFGLLQHPLEALRVGDVAPDAEHPEVTPSPNRSEEQELAIPIIPGPGPEPELEMLLRFAPERPVVSVQCVVDVLGVDQVDERTADPVVCAPARDRREGRAELRDQAGLVGLPHDDPGRLDEAAVPSLDLPEGLLGPLAIADVASHHQPDRLGLGVDPAHADVDCQGGPAARLRKIPLPRVEEPRLIQGLGHPFQALGARAGEQVAQRHRAGLLLLQARQPEGRGIEIDDGQAGGIEEEKRVIRLSEQAPGDQVWRSSGFMIGGREAVRPIHSSRVGQATAKGVELDSAADELFLGFFQQLDLRGVEVLLADGVPFWTRGTALLLPDLVGPHLDLGLDLLLRLDPVLLLDGLSRFPFGSPLLVPDPVGAKLRQAFELGGMRRGGLGGRSLCFLGRSLGSFLDGPRREPDLPSRVSSGRSRRGPEPHHHGSHACGHDEQQQHPDCREPEAELAAGRSVEMPLDGRHELADRRITSRGSSASPRRMIASSSAGSLLLSRDGGWNRPSGAARSRARTRARPVSTGRPAHPPSGRIAARAKRTRWSPAPDPDE